VNLPSHSSAAASDVRPVPNSPPSLRDSSAAPSLVDSYRRLADVFHDVLSEQDLEALLERIAHTVQDLIPCDGITVYETDDLKRELTAVFATGKDAQEVLADDPFPYGEGLTGWAVEHLEPVLANRAELDPRVRWVDNTERDPESLIVVPLIARQGLRGTLNIYRDGLQEFSEVEYALAKRFGDAAALAIDNAHIRATLELQAQTDPLTGLWNHRAFHELLREELLRASAAHDSVALVMFDLDDFKRVNDVYGHALGDQVLAELAVILRGAVRSADAVCRIGGEEFAIVLPSGDRDSAAQLAGRVCTRVEATDFGAVGSLRFSAGIALGPAHAANPRELVACAEAAMMTAKVRGKGRIVVFGEHETERPAASESERREEFRSIAHLKMLHGASAKLSRLNETAEIGATIANELRRLIDYHNCRVFVIEGEMLRPVAFVGDLSSHDSSAIELLTTKVGVGITGHVAETGEPFLTGDAANSGIGVQVEGTPEIEESLLAVPLRYGASVVGVVVISKLGLDQFDADDLRLLEVLAGHASVALVNAQLYESQRREAEMAKALLELSRELSATTELDEVLARAAEGAARILGSPKASVWLPEGGPDGDLVCRAVWMREDARASVRSGWRLPGEASSGFRQLTEPFLLERAAFEQLAAPEMLDIESEALAVAPIVIDRAWGALAVSVTRRATFDQGQLELLGGIASQAKLAIANAQSFDSLEHTFLSTVEALANALEAKDEYTSSHARWITDMALRVGAELGLDQAALKRVELGALFHDIGKIGIPASILTKPGPLTDDEWALLRRHPELGERILAPIAQLEDVRPIVRACHERYDGKGYPDGLRGEEIPLEARIIFVCDAFHAMTTDRPYRRALPVEEARRRLLDAAGTQFDSRVVEVCLRILEAPAE
jgi:diguanylate cyclase (GGDEF)-like protein